MQKRKLLITILIYMILMIPMFTYNLTSLYKNNEVLFYVYKKEDGKIDHSFIENIIDDIKVQYFTFYLIKDISAKIIYNDETFDTIIRSWDEHRYSKNSSFIIDWKHGLFSSNAFISNNYTVCFNKSILLNDEKAKLILSGKSFDVIIENYMTTDYYKYNDYKAANDDGLLLKDEIPVTFCTEKAFSEYYSLYYSIDIIEFNEIEFDSAIINLPIYYNPGLKYKEIKNFIKIFESNNYIVKRNIPQFENNYIFMKVSYFMLITIIMGVVALKLKKCSSSDYRYPPCS